MRPPIAALIAVVVASGPAGSRTWYLEPDGSGDAPSIQAAVDSSSAGDVILLGPGIYAEKASLSGRLTITSVAGPEATVIDAGGIRDRCLTTPALASQVVIDGLTLTGISPEFETGCIGTTALDLRGPATVSNCIIRDNTAPSSWGAVTCFEGSVTIRDCEFRNNVAGGCGMIDYGWGAGAIWKYSGQLHVLDTVFDGNWGLADVLMNVTGTSTLERCVIRNHNTYYENATVADYQGDAGPTTLRDCLIYDNQGDFLGRLPLPMDLRVYGNTFARNAFTSPFSLKPGSIFLGNSFSGSTYGLSIADTSGVVIACNNAFGNDTNWIGLDPAGVNTELDPLFCTPGGEDFLVSADSPLLPANNFCGIQIGAHGAGCGPVGLRAESWGSVKARYRGP